MTARLTVTNEEIIDAYRATGSVWRAGRRLGISGQSVHTRLRALGYPLAARVWTAEEKIELAELVGAGLSLSQAAERLGRSYAAVACQASEMQIRVVRNRPRRLPRGAGWDKETTRRHARALSAFSGTITMYARANGLSLELFVQALQQHVPAEWQRYVESHSDLPRRTCPYCREDFIPANNVQRYCTRKCASDSRTDASYFGGRRRFTVGLAEGVCQLCRRSGVKGLSSHHVLGKENDPDNQVLVALCPGCHKVVTLLATRNFVDDADVWQELISLVWARKHGGDTDLDGQVVEVIVEIENYRDDDPAATA